MKHVIINIIQVFKMDMTCEEVVVLSTIIDQAYNLHPSK